MDSHIIFCIVTALFRRISAQAVYTLFFLFLQNHVYEWSRDHRVHHKFSETNADPHNARRGFFFSHVGWLLCRKHPDVIAKGKLIDTSDLLADPFVAFQKKYALGALAALGIRTCSKCIRMFTIELSL